MTVTYDLNPSRALAFTADFKVQPGDSGDDVKALQVLLNLRGAGLTVDGVFGSVTTARVVELQQSFGLQPDGIVGAVTWRAVRSALVMTREAGSVVNVRSQPEFSAPILQTLQVGEPIVILGRSAAPINQGYHWFHVGLEHTDITGWVREDLVQILAPFTLPLPVANHVTIQSRPRVWFSAINPMIEAAIRDQFRLGFRDRVRYLFHPLSDLEHVYLVYVLGRGGTGGSPLLVLSADDRDYHVISNITTVQQPVVIANERSFGYPDLVVYTAGGGLSASYRRLRFDGNTYPTSPSMEPAVPAGSSVRGIALTTRITPELAAPLVDV